MKNFAPFLYNLRSSAGLSLEELAKLVDTSKSSLSRLENNEVPQPFKGPARKLIIRLAEILCTSKNEIKRYLELAEIDQSLLSETEQIQVGFAPAIASGSSEEIISLERSERIYTQLLTQLEAKKAQLEDSNLPANLTMKIQEYTGNIQEIQKRLSKVHRRQASENVQHIEAGPTIEKLTTHLGEIAALPVPPIPTETTHPSQQPSFPVLTDEQKRLFDTLLAMDGDLLTGQLEGSNTEISRRALLRQVLAIIAGASLILSTHNQQHIELQSNIISDDLIAFFENTMASHWELYHTGGAIRITHTLDPWIKEIRRLAQLTQGTGWHNRILTLLTMSHQLQSCVLRDTMNYSQAHTAYQRAFHVAQELDSAELMSSALAREGVTFIQQDKPKQAIIYLDGALNTIDGHNFPRLKGHILQALSEANAKAQQEQNAWYNIGIAGDIEEQQVQEQSLVRFNKSSLKAQKGIDAVLLGDYQQAIRLLDESLLTYDPALIRGRARLLAQKAEAYYGLGMIEACTKDATEALTLGRSAGSSKTIARITTLYTTLTQSLWRKEQSIVQLGEMLS